MFKVPADLVEAAQAAQRKWKVWASVSLAQYGIESAWGTKEPKGSNNGFGIQALPGLPSVAARSFEYRHGVRVNVTEHFAVFKSVADAFDKHGELIATNKAYAKAMATTTAQDFVKALGPVYATAPTYATVILGIMRENNLEEYDKLSSSSSLTSAPTNPVSMEVSMVTTTKATVPVTTGVIAPATTTPTPSIDQNVHVDIGSALASLFHNAEPAAEALANYGITSALATVPFGSVIVGYATPLVDQYVKSAFTQVEATLEAVGNIDVPAGNIVFTTAARMFNDNEKALTTFLGGSITPMLQAAVKKLGLPITI